MLKKYEKLLIWIIMIISSFFMIRLYYFNLDTSWQMNFGLNILEKNLPYKDFTLVPTPLYPYISSIFLLIFKNSYGYFLAQTFITISFVWTVSLILNHFIKNDSQYFYLIVLFVLSLSIVPDYNYFLLTLSNLSAFFIVKFLDTNKKYNLILSGIFLSFLILCKQSTGVVTTLFIAGYFIYTCFKEKKLKNILPLAFSFIGVNILFLIYLIKNHIFKDFLDYAFFGLFGFGSKNHSTFERLFESPQKTFIFVLLMTLIIVNIFFFIKTKNKTIKYFILAGLGNCFCILPIINVYHMICALIGLITPMIFFIDTFLDIKLIIKNKYLFLVFLITFSLLDITARLVSDQQEFVIYNGGFLENVYMQEKTVVRIEDINNYINSHEENVYITPEEIATIAKLANGKVASKPLDIFNNGNFGTKTAIETIKEINIENGYFYIYKEDDDRILPQVPLEAIEYIKENYEKVDETKYFDIYKIG